MCTHAFSSTPVRTPYRRPALSYAHTHISACTRTDACNAALPYNPSHAHARAQVHSTDTRVLTHTHPVPCLATSHAEGSGHKCALEPCTRQPAPFPREAAQCPCSRLCATQRTRAGEEARRRALSPRSQIPMEIHLPGVPPPAPLPPWLVAGVGAGGAPSRELGPHPPAARWGGPRFPAWPRPRPLWPL